MSWKLHISEYLLCSRYPLQPSITSSIHRWVETDFGEVKFQSCTLNSKPYWKQM